MIVKLVEEECEMEDREELQDKKTAMLLLLEQYIKNDEKEKAAILAQKIEEINIQIEEESKIRQ